MARIRTIKPEFFRHVGLYELEKETGFPIRTAFSGIWTACDREGRFKWEPRVLKLDCIPFDDCDFSRVLDALTTRGFIRKYTSEGASYGFIPSWHDHQVINNRESESKLPDPANCSIESITSTREARVNDATVTPLMHAQVEGKGKEGKGRGKEGVDARGSRLPKDFQPSVLFAVEQGISAADEFDKFRDYWNSQPGQKGVKTDWQATWRNWCRNAKKPAGHATNNAPTETTYQRSMRLRHEEATGTGQYAVIEMTTNHLEIVQ
jgi:hypothetical protein